MTRLRNAFTCSSTAGHRVRGWDVPCNTLTETPQRWPALLSTLRDASFPQNSICSTEYPAGLLMGELQQKLCRKEGEIPFGNDTFSTQDSTVLTLFPTWAGRAPRPWPTQSLEGKLHRPLAQHGGSSATGGSPQSGLRVQAPALGAERRAPREFALRFSINCLQ